MVNKKVLLGVVFFVVLALIGVQAQSDELAEWQYEQAKAAYERGDCMNASVHAKLALGRFTASNVIPGVEKTNALIIKINDCLRPIGDAYFLQALDYYTNGARYLNSADFKNARAQFDLSMAYLQMANSVYQYLIPPDTSKLTQINTKMADVTQKIKECEQLRADELYNKALYYIQKEDYGLALEYADNASEICAQYGNTGCVLKCDELRVGIRGKLAELIDRAKYYYEKGMEAYTSANCTNDKFIAALENFKQAKETYLKAREYSQVENCDYILNRTNDALRGCMQELIASLDNDIRDARTDLVLAGDNCSKYADIMTLVIDTQKHANLLLEKFGLAVFEERAAQCSELRKKIDSANTNCNESFKAEAMYNNASKMFLNAEYEGAFSLATNAKSLFEKSNNWAGVTKVDRLLDDLNEMLIKVNESNADYEKSKAYLKVADYENASYYLGKAKASYAAISRVKDVAKCDQTMEEIRTGNATKGKADTYYSKAVENFDSRDFGTARINAESAKNLYKRINDVEGLAKVDELLRKMPEQPGGIPTPVLLVLAFVLVIIFMWTRAKVSREKKQRTEVETKSRIDEEKRLAEMEAERKKREEEKERMMIERKRLKEMLEKEKRAIKGGDSASGNNIGGNGKGPAGNGSSPAADRQKAEDERAMLEKMLSQERDSLKKEKAMISEQLGLRQSKVDVKHDAPAESSEAISDREKIKEMVDSPANHGSEPHSDESGMDEIERLRELIKKEREAMKKS